MKLLFAASELYPLIKTGGLADVAHSLPNALTGLKVDVRVVLPAYRQVLLSITSLRVLGWLPVSGGRQVRILEASHPEVTAGRTMTISGPSASRSRLPRAAVMPGDVKYWFSM